MSRAERPRPRHQQAGNLTHVRRVRGEAPVVGVTTGAAGPAGDGGGPGYQNLWRWYLAVAAASGCGFFIPTVAQTVGWGLVYVGCYLLCVVAILLGVRLNRPARSLAWYLLAAGYGMVAVAVAVWYPYVLWTGTVLGYPSIADGLFLSSYAILLAGLVALTRSRSAGRDRAGLLDAAIMASGMGVLGWVFLIQPQLAVSTLSFAGRAATIAYPLVDVVLVGILARMAFAPGVRRPGLLAAGARAARAADRRRRLCGDLAGWHLRLRQRGHAVLRAGVCLCGGGGVASVHDQPVGPHPPVRRPR
jgi:hypothetical protein